MSARYTRIAAAALLLSALSACATPEPEGGYHIDNQNEVHPTLNTVRVLDDTLAHYKDGGSADWRVKSVLDVENVAVSPTETGFPRLTVELRNKTHQQILIEVRARWYDANGASTDAPQSWTRIFLEPMSMGVFNTVSVNMASRQYYVEVRGAQ